MWTARKDALADPRGVRLALVLDARPATFAGVLCGWQQDAGFRALFNALLADTAFTAFRWETPAATAATVTRQFECVLLDSHGLARRPEPEAFAEQFAGAEGDVVTFAN